MIWPSPMEVLREGVRKVPELKWSLMIAGIIAVVAVVTAGWKLDPKLAVFGTVVMLILMTVAVVFARLSTTAVIEFRYPVLVLMWASISLALATAVLLFTSAFFSWPLTFNADTESVYRPKTDDKKVWDLEEQVNTLRGTWETVPVYGEATRNEVLDRATKLGQQLLDIDDKNLGPSGHVIKREFSCYAFLMAADTETNLHRKVSFAEKAISLCDSAAGDLQYVFNNDKKNKNLAYVSNWAKKESQVPFVDYLSAMATCIVGVAGNDPQKRAEVTAILDRIPTPYLNRYPPKRDTVLKQCVSIEKEGAQ